MNQPSDISRRSRVSRRKDAYPVSITQLIVPVLTDLGINLNALAHQQDLDLSPLRVAAARVDGEKLDQLLLSVLEQIEPARLAEPVARHWHPGHLGALGYSWLSSSTLMTGLLRLQRHWRIVSDLGRLHLDEQGAQVVVTFERDSGHDRLDHVLSEVVFAMLVRMCRANAGENFAPRQVRFRLAQPPDDAPMRAVFKSDMCFGATQNQLVIDQAWATQRLVTADLVIAGTFDRMLAQAMAELNRDDALGRAKAIVLKTLTSGLPEAADVASQLHMSARTLQRKLAEQGTTYADLVEETRKDLALRYLADSGKSMSEIAFLVGFASQSSFTRAFNRWTGMAPSDYRGREARVSG